MSTIDTALSWLTQQLTSAGAAIESITDEWERKVTELKARAHDFSEIYPRLKSKAESLPPNTPLHREAMETLADADRVKATIQAITGKIDAASTGFRALGRGGLMSGMGVIPLLAPIPLAIIVGALTVLGISINKMLSVERQVDAALAAGADPTQIGLSAQPKTIVESVIGRGGLLSNPIVLISLAGVAYLMWPEIKKRFFS